MTSITADHLRELLDSDEEDATLVLVRGEVQVVAASELESAGQRGALAIASRRELLEQAGDQQLSGDQLEQLAANLQSRVRNLGG